LEVSIQQSHGTLIYRAHKIITSYHEMGLPDIDINTVVKVKLLRESKTSKSPGPDGIHRRILKELAVPLTTIFKCSIDLGHVPLC